MNDARPDPDALLEQVNEEQRARFKIFFGFAPGVGKTFAMLESARRLKALGVDVVVGLLETHGREETAALLEGLEVLPRRVVEHRGYSLLEFDLEGVIARRPQVVLIDELAHENVPGSRHARRWQDVLEVLDEGIEVHTTLNVQHLESLNDVVAQITRVRVRETVPDSLLERADQIELIDLPPEDLLKRMAEGKVYLGAQGAYAAENFFRKGNLLALRELALRSTAERVDAEVLAYRRLYDVEQTWPSGERLAVCVGPSPGSARVVRSTRRMAEQLKAPWHALWVERPLRPLSQADQTRLDANLELATALGGEVVRFSSEQVATSILDWARQHNVTRLVIGKPTHPRLWDRLQGSLLDTLVRGSGDIDVLVISGEAEDSPRVGPPPRERGSTWRAWLASTGVVALTTIVTALVDRVVRVPSPEMIYLLAIMVVAASLGRVPALLASGLSVAAFDFFFVAPRMTFAFADIRYGLTFATMFLVGAVISTLTSRLRRQEQAALEREQRTRALFTLSRELSEAKGLGELAQTTARHCAEAIPGAKVVVLVEGSGGIEVRGAWPAGTTLLPRELGVAEWVLERQREAGSGTDTLAGAAAFCAPLGKRVGVIALMTSEPEVSLEDRSTLVAFATQATVAFERFQLGEEARSSALRAHTQELRSALLSTVSHDLRTPLAVVTGAASTLRDVQLGEESRAALLATICDEAERLERLVRNLLEMTQVQSGALNPKREWVAIEEVVGSARQRLARSLAGRTMRVDLAPDASWTEADPLLLEQVILNLLENALKYSPEGTPIEVATRRTDGGLHFTVSDRGRGFAPEEAEKLFEMFYRSPNAEAGGAGLGLAVCRGIVEAHRGRIRAYLREGGGAAFEIFLPGSGSPPAVPEEEEFGA